MATYSQLGRGDRGDEVKTLQELLNSNGYNLSVDGSFGPATESAVKDYQQKNNLTADGIAGENFWNSINGTGATDAAKPEEDKSFKYDSYKPGDSVNQAQELLNQQLGQKPGDYQSNYTDHLNAAIDDILNRKPFSYNLNEDALYKQLTDQYIAQGQMAMLDTTGQALAMTGGYGNSYAQSVGQQAYQNYLQQLNESVPDLYQMALSRYQLEGDELANRYGILANQESQDYDRYQAAMNAYLAERDYLAGRYDAERDYDYGQYYNDKNFAYEQYRNDIADQQWQAQFDEAKRQFDLQFNKTTSSGGGGGGGGSSYYSADDDVDEPASEEVDLSYSGLRQQLAAMKQNGASRSEIAKIISDAEASGIIGRTQSDYLRSVYL